MPNKILKIILKDKEDRSLSELSLLLQFYLSQSSTSRLLRYAVGIDNLIKENGLVNEANRLATNYN